MYDALQQLKDSINAGALPGANVKGAVVASVNGEDVGIDDITNVDKVPLLVSRAEYLGLPAFQHGLGEDSHHSSFSVGVLSGAVDVPVAQNGIVKMVQAVVQLHVLLGQVL